MNTEDGPGGYMAVVFNANWFWHNFCETSTRAREANGDLGPFIGKCVIRSVECMTEDFAPNDRRRKKRIKNVATIVGVALLGTFVAAGVNYAVTGRTADSGTSIAISDTSTVAGSEHAYALSLPVLDSWIENDFPNAWITVSNTLEHVARTLEVASGNQEDYALWVPRFERVIAVAEAVSNDDKAAARTAFDPLIAEEPGPYTDVTPDGTLSADPFADATASLLKLETAIAAEDRGAARQSVANTAAALSEMVLKMQVDLPADTAPEVLDRLLPAFYAIDDIQDAVLHGNAKDAAAGATQLREALETFENWHLNNAS